MLSQIAKQAASQWDQVETIRQQWVDAKESIDAAKWMLECAIGSDMEELMEEVVNAAMKAEREAYARLQSISSQARSLSHCYSQRLNKG